MTVFTIASPSDSISLLKVLTLSPPLRTLTLNAETSYSTHLLNAETSTYAPTILNAETPSSTNPFNASRPNQTPSRAAQQNTLTLLFKILKPPPTLQLSLTPISILMSTSLSLIRTFS